MRGRSFEKSIVTTRQCEIRVQQLECRVRVLEVLFHFRHLIDEVAVSTTVVFCFAWFECEWVGSELRKLEMVIVLRGSY